MLGQWRSLVDWPWREYEEVLPIDARRVRVRSGEVLVQACSTQYLGLAWNFDAEAAVRKEFDRAQAGSWGSFGSNYLGGTHEERLILERYIADECSTEGAIAFASGWAANYCVGEALGRVCDLVVSDIRNHNSMIHGLRAGGARVERLDLSSVDVSELLRSSAARSVAIIAPTIEGITGQSVSIAIPPEDRGRVLEIRDECHSFGAVGLRGSELFGGSEPDVRIVSFSKACGSMGAAVCAPQEFLDALKQLGSPWMFSTAVPPIIWRTTRVLLPIMLAMSEQRALILELAEQFRSELLAGNVSFTGAHHITGVRLGAADAVRAFEDKVRKAGYFVKASEYPTRPRNDPYARVAFTPHHCPNDAEGLARAIGG